MFNILIIIFFLSLHNFLFAQATDSPKFDNYKELNNWDEWLFNTKKDIEKLNYKSNTLSQLDDLKFIKRVIELDKKQPEFKITLNEYLSKVIPVQRVKEGRKKFKDNKKLLFSIEKKFNISPFLLTSLWGIETSYGKHTGNFDVLNSLATLSFEGRRAEFFYNEFKNSLDIIDKGFINRKNLKGSWAGAIGQTQFMPSTYLAYAIDFNNNGLKDLLNDKGDALASGANYLNKLGWKNNLNWGEEVFPITTLNFEKLYKNKIYKNEKFWKKFGIVLKKDYNNEKLRLVKPDKNIKVYYLVSSNFDIILNWNRSNYFALAVNILSDKIKNEKK